MDGQHKAIHYTKEQILWLHPCCMLLGKTAPDSRNNTERAASSTWGSMPVCCRVAFSTADNRSSAGVSLKPPRLALQTAVRSEETTTTSSSEDARRS